MNPLDITIHQEDERGNVYALRQELRYQDLIVPIGYESDGASVPRFFWRYVFPPGDVHAMRAAFLHDYVYREHPEGWTKKKADKMFWKSCLKTVAGNRRRRRHIMASSSLAARPGAREVKTNERDDHRTAPYNA